MKELKLHQIYKTASIVEDAIELGLSLKLTDSKFSETVRQKALDFNKETLLHLFIKQEFVNHYEKLFYDLTENVIEQALELDFLKQQFLLYDVPIDFLQIIYDENDYPITTENQIQKWYKKNEKKFTLLSEKLCDEVFFILFSNRKLLHKFNENVSMNFDKLQIPEKFLTQKGTIKRRPFPVWLKDAIFHRDKAVCCLCSANLDKKNNIEIKSHYDHIIPLDLFGINDPTNVQLLCGKCNSEKGKRNSNYGRKYVQWFA